MRIQISACTDKVFSEGLLPLAYLTESSAFAVNDNALRLQSKSKVRLHWRRVACLAQHAAR
jgi:hypothetical protein